MNVLGIETSSHLGSLALSDTAVRGSRREYIFSHGREHLEKLFPALDKFLKNNNITPKKINGLAVGQGPGSYTGTRLGVTAARMLAQIWCLPLVGISSLDTLVWQWAESARPVLSRTGVYVCPLISALRAEVYTAVFVSRLPASSGWTYRRLSPNRLLSAAALPEFIQSLKLKNSRIYFVGNGARAHQDMLNSAFKNQGTYYSLKTEYPLARGVARLGEIMLSRPVNGRDYQKVLPLYLRPSEAEQQWTQKHRK